MATLRPKYLLYGYMEPLGKAEMRGAWERLRCSKKCLALRILGALGIF